MDETTLRKEIHDKVRQFAGLHGKRSFEAGKTRIPYAGRVYDHEEMVALVDSALDFWLTAGRYSEQFEREFAASFGTRYCALTNSGSSANLLALSSLTGNMLGEKRLKSGDKAITCAAGFPTTLNPIFQNGLVPIFVDAELGTYNAKPDAIEEAAEKDGVRAIMLAHMLGNPFDLDAVMKTAKKHDLYVIEDCCDAVGAMFDGKPVGTFGDIATASFYPAHHMTMGEGGAVMTSSQVYKKLIESFRDWGRDCWCPPGKDNTCKKRFGWKLGELPYGYDHKYTYSNIGYNLKVTDMQAAIGVAQLKKLPGFVRKRRENFDYLMNGLGRYSDCFILPKKHPKAEPSPFGFPLTVKKDAPFDKNQIIEHLESKGIATRMLFAGNLVRQPAYIGKRYEVVGSLENSDIVMNYTFWIGVYPGLGRDMLEYMVETFDAFINEKAKR
jgi:CDP-6-deoxy-D-xylo-4-hexulose-3-dehydrase